MLFLLAIGMMATAKAQKDSSKTSETGSFLVPGGKSEMIGSWSPKDSVLKITNFKAVKSIEIGGRVLNVPILMQTELLFTYPDWIVAIYNILETASTGLSKNQVSQLQQILVPYVQFYQEKQKQQNQKQ